MKVEFQYKACVGLIALILLSGMGTASHFNTRLVSV